MQAAGEFVPLKISRYTSVQRVTCNEIIEFQFFDQSKKFFKKTASQSNVSVFFNGSILIT